MQSFTFASTEARAAVVAAMRAEGDEPFTATYTLNDSRTIFRALRHVSVLSPDLSVSDDLAARFAKHLSYLEGFGENHSKLAVVWSADQVRVVLDALCEHWQDNASVDAALLASGIATLYSVEWV